MDGQRWSAIVRPGTTDICSNRRKRGGRQRSQSRSRTPYLEDNQQQARLGAGETMTRKRDAEMATAREVSDRAQEMQQLIQLSRQREIMTEQTQSPDGRFENVPFFDPTATSYNK